MLFVVTQTMHESQMQKGAKHARPVVVTLCQTRTIIYLLVKYLMKTITEGNDYMTEQLVS